MREYEIFFRSQGAKPQKSPFGHSFNHLLEMALEAQGWSGDKCNKMMRWIGYIQGVLVAKEIFTLDAVKKHSQFRKVDGE